MLSSLSFFNRNPILGTLDFSGLEDYAPFSFSKSRAFHSMITESVFLYTIFYSGDAAITHMLQNKDSDPYRSVCNKNLPQGKCMKFVLGVH